MSDVDPYRDEAPPELAGVRSGEDLDWKRIEAYLRENLPAAGLPLGFDITPVSGPSEDPA